MARLTDRGFTEEEAEEFQERASGPHTLKWTADVFRWIRGDLVEVYDNLPIVGGTLSLDGSDPTRRRLTLDIGGGEALIPDDPADALAPFGQVIKLWLLIDRADGSWFPRLKMFEGPIQTTTTEWPSLTQTVEAADYSWLIDAYLFEKKISYNKKTVRQAVQDIVRDAVPEAAFYIQSPNDSQNIKVEAHTVSEAGQGRWEFAQQVCAATGFTCFFNHNGNLVIRRDITNADDETETVPGEGPDIGTVSNPAAIVKDGPGGNLIALTVGLTKEGAVNGVIINLHETISQKLAARKVREADSGNEEDDPDDTTEDGNPVEPDDTDDDPELQPIPNPGAGDPRVNVAIKAYATGSIAWGNRFGRHPIVLERNVKRINNSVVNHHKKRAKRLLHRRGGVIRSVDLDAVGCYWVEPDDKIRLKYADKTEAHFVASVDIDLAGEEPTRIRTRSLTTDDPG